MSNHQPGRSGVWIDIETLKRLEGGTLDEVTDVLKELRAACYEMGGGEQHVGEQTMEDVVRVLLQIVRHHDTRFEELTATMNKLGERMTALVDAQVRTCDAFAQLSCKQAESQQRADVRLNALIDIVAQGKNGGDLPV